MIKLRWRLNCDEHPNNPARDRKDLSFTRAPSSLQPSVPSFVPTQLSYGTHGTRKVKVATKFDPLDIVTDELNGKLAPISSRRRQLRKKRAEQWKVRTSSNVEAILDAEMAPAGCEVPGESIYYARELSELDGLVNADWTSEYGYSVTGLYDLVGVSTELLDSNRDVQGNVFHGKLGEANAKDDENWYKFDDEMSVPEGDVGDDLSKGGAGSIYISPPTPEQGTPNAEVILDMDMAPAGQVPVDLEESLSTSCVLLLAIGNHPLAPMTSSVYGWRTCAYGDESLSLW
ncbi:hypothetical protein M405DRAFT_880065 [Rhizopogon salebrosus TDB-379]|nr:hypothetical protein M405DRAFT_880065 [Rhizopogon salebrosus TDB-379]